MAAGKGNVQTMPACRRCRHYFITHDSARPYGCRALGFKSRHNPALVVFSTSGIPCQLFCKKSAPPAPGGDEPNGV